MRPEQDDQCGVVTIRCPNCGAPLKVRWTWTPAVREVQSPAEFEIRGPDICSSCGDWIGGQVDEMKQAAWGAIG